MMSTPKSTHCLTVLLCLLYIIFISLTISVSGSKTLKSLGRPKSMILKTTESFIDPGPLANKTVCKNCRVKDEVPIKSHARILFKSKRQKRASHTKSNETAESKVQMRQTIHGSPTFVGLPSHDHLHSLVDTVDQHETRNYMQMLNGQYTDDVEHELTLASDGTGIRNDMSFTPPVAPNGAVKGILSHDFIKKLQEDPTWDMIESKMAPPTHIQPGMKFVAPQPIGRPIVVDNTHALERFHDTFVPPMSFHGKNRPVPEQHINHHALNALNNHNGPGYGQMHSKQSYNVEGATVNTYSDPWAGLRLSYNTEVVNHPYNPPPKPPSGPAPPPPDEEPSGDGEDKAAAPGPNLPGPIPKMKKIQAPKKAPVKGSAVSPKQVAQALKFADSLDKESKAEKEIKDTGRKPMKAGLNKIDDGKSNGAETEDGAKSSAPFQGNAKFVDHSHHKGVTAAFAEELKKVRPDDEPGNSDIAKFAAGIKEVNRLSPKKVPGNPKQLTNNFVKFMVDMAAKLKVDKLKVAEELVKNVEHTGKKTDITDDSDIDYDDGNSDEMEEYDDTA